LAVEALAQRVARRDVPQPEIDPSLVLGDATRPQPVDQDARPVAGTRRLVDALQRKRRHRDHDWHFHVSTKNVYTYGHGRSKATAKDSANRRKRPGRSLCRLEQPPGRAADHAI